MEFFKQKISGNRRLNTPACLTVAGSDSGGEAGIQADLQTFNDFHCHGLTAITAITAQNRNEVLSLNPSPHQALKDQLTAVNSYFSPSYIKTGLISSLEQMQIIAQFLVNKKAVIDPVLKATSGQSFINSDLRDKFIELFCNQNYTITPNFNELCWILKLPRDSNQLQVISKAQEMMKKSAVTFFLKGGHTSEASTDYLIQDNNLIQFKSPLLCSTHSMHGTGCRISSGICAALAQGFNLIEACQLAKNYVYHTLANNSLANNHKVMCSPGKISELEMKVTYQEFLNDK